ncbi:MAG: capsid cement protein [Phenylobacterium sp.]|uniref:capsid cement protein n=1 Tax=Phenylobacterium sp. TaxID=1871053 RepID=UPI00391C5464
MRTYPALPLTAGAPIAPRRFVKFSGDRTVVQATAATDAIIGVSDSLGAAATGDRVEIYVMGPGLEVEAGGNITRGAEITSDANGKAVAAAPAAGASCRTAGVAMASYVAGDVAEYLAAPGSKTTPA